MKTISQIIGGAQALLDINFDLQQCFEEKLSEEYRKFIDILRVIEALLPLLYRPYAGIGRRPYQWLPFLRGHLAKSHFHIDKTKDLIARLNSDPNQRLICGFTHIPGKASFSRAFTFLVKTDIVNKAQDAMVIEAHKDRYIQHVNRDSTAIAARETVVKRTDKKGAKQNKKRGRPPKNAIKTQKETPAIENQVYQSARFAIAKLDKKCSWGCKKNSQGNVSFWRGYKLHLDTSDSGFPLTACVTAASVHDSQLAIPMEKLTEKKVAFLYSLMDSAYDSKVIASFIRGQGRIPIIDPNKRKDNLRPPLDPAKKERFKIRSTSERTNSDLKDNYIPKSIYVRGHKKVSFVLMAGVLCLSAVKYLAMLN
jgi:hypothetical protein